MAGKRALLYLSTVIVPLLITAGYEHVTWIDHEWNNFKIDYGKVYNPINGEELMRKGIFVENVKAIAVHNRQYLKGLETYTQDINQFTDLTFEEFKEKVLFDVEDTNFATDDTDGPEFSDGFWLEKAENFSYPLHLIPVRDQGECGSCWAFATTAIVEYHYAMKYGKVFDLSVQELLNCDIFSTGCFGGLAYHALRYIQYNNISAERDLPYKGVRYECPLEDKLPPRAPVHVKSVIDHPVREYSLAEVLKTNGPLAVIILADENLSKYKSGVFKSSTCRDNKLLHHTVVLLGYGSDSEGSYWILRNSWGLDWGEKGNFRMVRGETMCNIGQWPSVSATFK